MTAYKNILYATDLLEDSAPIAKKAKQVAENHQAELRIIHVIEPLPVYAYTYIDSVSLEKKHIDEATNLLAELSKTLKVSQDKQLIKIGHAKTEIIEYADKNKVDLIIVGSHIHHGLGRLLGSTANGITHAAHCDVLVIRYKES